MFYNLVVIHIIQGPFKHTKNITLRFPNTVHDEFGNEGTWTMVYDQGFEVRVAGRSYFAFSKFVKVICNLLISNL